ncbi:SIS domain-containing protein [Sphingomonas sp.]|jgi:arabinose-5-phosphate isomerase|uniref:KpsF/GutQ family sugar-phosphate isomerase n=1 Tax=Sphingomonas sp. TaxID=28214 RepID=UPI0035C7D56E
MLAPNDPFLKRKLVRRGRRTVGLAAEALEALAARFNDPSFETTFEDLVDRVHGCTGRIIVTGLGKSGIVARKIAATFIATGTQAMYLHPADAGLGDVGLIEPGDVVLIVSRTGSVEELAPVVTYCRRFAIPLAVVASSAKATAARFADLLIQLPRVREACPVTLSPTTSTTVQLVFGDALAVAVMARRGFSQEDFHRFHPSGLLGAQLLKVADLMATGDKVPMVAAGSTLIDATVEMTRTRYGGTAVVDADGRLIGAFTDGDLRRTIGAGANMRDPVSRWMTAQPSAIEPRAFASEALARMQGQSILMLFVVERDRLIGALHMHDVLEAGTA